MYNSLGAIPMAIDRIVGEQLLNNYNFTFKIYNDDCVEALDIGYGAKLLANDDVNVVFGPVCNAGAMIVGSLGNFYDKPIMTWGFVNSYTITDQIKYPTISTIVGNTKSLSQALVLVMKKYDWKQFAFITSTVDTVQRCQFMQTDLQSVLDDEPDIFISYQKAMKATDLTSYKNVLKNLSQKARIIVGCFVANDDRRNYLLALNDLKMNTDEYVSIILGIRGYGFGSRYTDGAEIDVVSNTVPVWIQSPLTNTALDGRNADAKNGARTTYFLDFEVNTAADLKGFSEGVITRAQSWPFYCENCSDTYWNASTYSRYLYDFFYLYALALNKTIKTIGVQEVANISGSSIIDNTRGIFLGMTGTVRITVQVMQHLILLVWIKIFVAKFY